MTTIYLIPSVLADRAFETIPSYVLDAIKQCQVIFAENERTARRFMKGLDKNIEISGFEWFPIHKSETEQIEHFITKISEQKNIAIISEAGCPGIADPGQALIAVAQKMNCHIKPLVGPSSILLALMASGMNGQQFEFMGYLPIDPAEREFQIKKVEKNSHKDKSTKIFIETPYRNNQLLEALLKNCHSTTRLCIAVNITARDESIRTLTIGEWKNKKPELHKKPAIFLLYAG